MVVTTDRATGACVWRLGKQCREPKMRGIMGQNPSGKQKCSDQHCTNRADKQQRPGVILCYVTKFIRVSFP